MNEPIMLAEVRGVLEDREKEVISPVFRIDEALVDSKLSSIEQRNQFLICTFVSAYEDRCTFEFHFGRSTEYGRFNFFFRLEAELYNYKSFDEDVSRREIAQDVDRFLRSRVHCERFVGKKGVAAEHYTLSNFVVNSTPVRFTFRSYYIGPLSKSSKAVVEYLPWLTQ